MAALLTATAVRELADPTDAGLARAVRLLAGSVPAGCDGLVAYHAEGYRAFLAAALTPPPARRTVLLRCLRAGGTPVAVADWRLIGDRLFLNGIAVEEAGRGQGLGSLLLRDGAGLARRLGRTALALDVAVDNAAAYRLYRRSGFVDESRAAFRWVPAQEPPDDEADLRFADWPSFAAHRAAYGFGDLRGDRAGTSWAVRLVGTALRVPADGSGPALHGALRRVLPVTRAYTVDGGTAADPGSDAPAIARFVRMCRPLAAAD